jgi:hypothetical protein
MGRSIKLPPRGQVQAPAATLAGLAVLLVAGLAGLGLLGRIDAALAGLLDARVPGRFVGGPHPFVLGAAVLLTAYGLPFVLLSVPGNTRRALLFTSTLLLLAAWVPVLALAAMKPAVSAPFLAALWAGGGALFYAARHRMPCDAPPPRPEIPAVAIPPEPGPPSAAPLPPP